MTERFTKSFTRQAPLPDAALVAADRVLRSGLLHRYGHGDGRDSEVGQLERAFADEVGARYCLAVASGGQAMAVALRAVGVRPGDRVLSNAFTLAPVPGAIAAVGATPLLIETEDTLCLDFDDLASKLDRASVLLLSHMRGHMCDMDRLMALCDRAGVTVVEDCAHTMGAFWNDVPSGRHGRVGCYSTQTYKHINSGEGGLLVSDDAELMARATVLSGCYMNFARHPAGPPPEAYHDIALETPNMSCRMDELRAAILRPQLTGLARDRAAWAVLYRTLEDGLRGTPGVALVPRSDRERFVGSSFQFRLPGWSAEAMTALIARAGRRGVEIKWFGAEQPVGFTSRYDHWRYAAPEPLPKTTAILASLVDLRLPLTFDAADAACIARILDNEIRELARPQTAAE